MSLFVNVRSFLRNLFFSRRVDGDLDQELQSHLDMLAEENIRAGMPPKKRNAPRAPNLVEWSKSKSKSAKNASAIGCNPSSPVAATVSANSASVPALALSLPLPSSRW